MVKFYDSIPESHIAWIRKQHIFYVATAPLTGEGHVNLSPKGLDGTFHIESPNRVWYEDLSGSGVETISHLRENGRITIMFCAFEGAARILRLWGRGHRHASSRAAIVMDVEKVSTSCGYAVPLYTFKGERSALLQWGEKMEKLDQEFSPRAPDDGDVDPAKTVTVDTDLGPRVYLKGSMRAWWVSMNLRSLDGLPGLRSAHLSDAALETGVAVRGEPEPPSDGTVVILGNKIPKGQRAGEVRKGVLLPQNVGEAVRLLVVFVLGLVIASAYGQSMLDSGSVIVARAGRLAAILE
ncbi:hypothetical protein C8Q77DRAFT_1213550 [Trametes polyzona]|nr:hypothetical protein C8Q77DRAFT_1213550 [Trametes polyzona]